MLHEYIKSFYNVNKSTSGNKNAFMTKFIHIFRVRENL